MDISGYMTIPHYINLADQLSFRIYLPLQTVAFADPSPSEIGSMEITMTHEEQFADYTIRYFTVLKEVSLSYSKLSHAERKGKQTYT